MMIVRIIVQRKQAEATAEKMRMTVKRELLILGDRREGAVLDLEVKNHGVIEERVGQKMDWNYLFTMCWWCLCK